MTEHVDGNTLAGPLSELFSFDMTAATGRCLGCGDVTVLARALVFTDPMGLVARCCECNSVLLALVESEDGLWLDLHGISGLHVPGVSARS